MSTSQTREIPLSKGKIFAGVLGCIVFVVFGYYLLTYFPYRQSNYNPTYVMAVGIMSMVVFGTMGIFSLKRLLTREPGLVINPMGVVDRSGPGSLGLIEWKDMTGVELKKLKSSQFLILKVQNPELYISKAKNVIAKRMAQINYRAYGSPITLGAFHLKCNLSELEQWLKEGLEQSQK